MRNKIFIMFEGIDGSGKSTLIKYVKSIIKNKFPKLRIKTLVDPDFNFVNKDIKKQVAYNLKSNDSIYYEFARGRKLMYNFYFNQSYDVYLIDRCWISSMVYQNKEYPIYDINNKTILNGLYVWTKISTNTAYSRIKNRVDKDEIDSILTFDKLVEMDIKYNYYFSKFRKLKLINNFVKIWNNGVPNISSIIEYIRKNIKHK